jgi:hypothetical protein
LLSEDEEDRSTSRRGVARKRQRSLTQQFTDEGDLQEEEESDEMIENIRPTRATSVTYGKAAKRQANTKRIATVEEDDGGTGATSD